MPEMDGLEVISHMRRESAIRDIPVIVVTGTSDLRDDLTLEQGLGICGWLTKPLSQSDLLRTITEAVGLGLGGSPDWTPPEESVNAEALPELRILLVDDYDDNRFVVQAHLEDTPYQIDTAENGEIAIDMFKSVNYDLVLMDVQMPVMDGYTATRIIRCWEHEQGLDPTPILALTANAFAEDVHKSMEAGCTGHINKPIRRAPLMAEIAGCTNGGSQ
jgi:CheY-like chemotaxis protein